MSYQRVIPRDLFNEGNLLKCLGQLYLELERLNLPDVTLAHDGEAFEIEQDESDGSLSVANVAVIFQGERLGQLVRPLNSRAPFPLWLRTDDDDRPLFDDSGRLDVAALLQGVPQ